jgi:hypothetical protein
MPDTPCSSCRDRLRQLEATQTDRVKWERKAMVILSDAVTELHPVNRTLADQLMKLVADLNRIGLTEKEARKG